MDSKVNPSITKTTKAHYILDFETLILATVFAGISTVFTMGGYNAHIPQLAIPCGIVATSCWILILQSLYSFIMARLKPKNEPPKCKNITTSIRLEQILTGLRLKYSPRT